MSSDRRPKRRCVATKAQAPSAVHYVGYVEDAETPEMIMKKFEQLERIQRASADARRLQQQQQQQQAQPQLPQAPQQEQQQHEQALLPAAALERSPHRDGATAHVVAERKAEQRSRLPSPSPPPGALLPPGLERGASAVCSPEPDGADDDPHEQLDDTALLEVGPGLARR
jgi:hypothetical protein